MNCSVLSINFSSVGGGWGLRDHEDFHFPASCQPTDRKVFSTPQNKEFLGMEAAFATRVNLVTRVVEVANFSCW